MTLSAGEYISGGDVRDADGRMVVVAEGGGGGGGGSGAPVVALGNVSGAVNVDLSQGVVFSCTMTGNTTFTYINWPSGTVETEPVIYATQDGTGGWTITLAGVVWEPSGTAPTWDTTAGHTNLIVVGSANNGTTIVGQSAGGGGGGSVPTVLEYTPGSTATYTIGASGADVDATNLAVTFTAPASGKVLVTVAAAFCPNSLSNIFYFGLREGATDLAYQRVSNGATLPLRDAAEFYLTGITGGSHTYKFAAGGSTTGGNLYAGTDTFGSVGGAIMIVQPC
jgi:hypothetical protein